MCHCKQGCPWMYITWTSADSLITEKLLSPEPQAAAGAPAELDSDQRLLLRHAAQHGAVLLCAPDEVGQDLAHPPKWHVLVCLCVAGHPLFKVAAGEVHTLESFSSTARHESPSAALATHIQSEQTSAIAVFPA